MSCPNYRRDTGDCQRCGKQCGFNGDEENCKKADISVGREDNESGGRRGVLARRGGRGSGGQD